MGAMTDQPLPGCDAFSHVRCLLLMPAECDALGQKAHAETRHRSQVGRVRATRRRAPDAKAPSNGRPPSSCSRRLPCQEKVYINSISKFFARRIRAAETMTSPVSLRLSEQCSGPVQRPRSLVSVSLVIPPGEAQWYANSLLLPRLPVHC